MEQLTDSKAILYSERAKAYFAHSYYSEDGKCDDQSSWQLLSNHLNNVGNQAAIFAAFFGGGELAKAEGKLHDLGKYSTEFQLRLEGKYGKVDHSTMGAKVAVARFGALGRLMAYAIAGHHAGLANGRDQGEITPLMTRLAKTAPEIPEIYEDWESEVTLPKIDANEILGRLKVVKERGYFQLAFLGRMLFSCLVDADYLDTERFYRSVEGRQQRDEHFPSLVEIRERLNQYMQGFKSDTKVNKLRSDILSEVKNKADLAPGLFSLNVPTGGGKTLASLAFALDHAIKHGLRRVIFAIPFTSIVEQNAAVFREALGDLGDKAVLEHHSNFDGQKQAASADTKDKLRLAQENWQAPIVVTTSVQFFESLYANKTSHCRKLHNISGSVVILDEVQTLPVKQLLPCVAAIDELACNYKTSLVLCSATQPAIEKTDEFKFGLSDVRPLIDKPEALHQALERVTVQHDGSLIDADLIEKLAEQEQVLCIVNSRRHARSLYQALSAQKPAQHLTTLMCAKHRSEKLKTIRQLLKEDTPCRLIATSLIEAGVDVDFPTVFRAEAGLDSIAQAAGRCNREGRRPVKESHVHIFNTANDWPTPPDLEQFAGAMRSVLRRFNDNLLSPEAIHTYFSDLYWSKGDKQMGRDFLKKIENGQLDGIPYEDMARDFRMIESVMSPVIIPFDTTAKQLIRDLKGAEKCGGIARKLQLYLVQVPQRALKALKEVGAVQPIQPEKFGEQFMVLVNDELYSQDFGLDWDDPTFISAEKSVI